VVVLNSQPCPEGVAKVNRDRIVTILIVVCIMAVIAGIGVIGFSDVTNAVGIDCIVGNPGAWAGEQVTLEGVAGLTTDNMFVLWDKCYATSITVRWAGEPAAGEGAEIAAMGEVVIEEHFGKDRVYLVASELRYLD
jgi:hypothetical protein